VEFCDGSDTLEDLALIIAEGKCNACASVMRELERRVKESEEPDEGLNTAGTLMAIAVLKMYSHDHWQARMHAMRLLAEIADRIGGDAMTKLGALDAVTFLDTSRVNNVLYREARDRAVFSITRERDVKDIKYHLEMLPHRKDYEKGPIIQGLLNIIGGRYWRLKEADCYDDLPVMFENAPDEDVLANCLRTLGNILVGKAKTGTREAVAFSKTLPAVIELMGHTSDQVKRWATYIVFQLVEGGHVALVREHPHIAKSLDSAGSSGDSQTRGWAGKISSKMNDLGSD